MSGQNDQFDRDDELRTLLRRSDPSRSLEPADPAGLARLLEDTMTDLDTRPVHLGTRDTGTRDRGPFTWLVAAAAAAIILGAGGVALSGLGGDDPAPQATDPTSTGPTTDEANVTQLTAGPPVTGRCAVPTPATVGTAEQAFAGTVTAIEGDTVTLQTTDVYTGEVAGEVQVAAPPEHLQALISAVQFEVGGSYLVSATDGQVSVCGFSGQASGPLQQLYNEAFVR